MRAPFHSRGLAKRLSGALIGILCFSASVLIGEEPEKAGKQEPPPIIKQVQPVTGPEAGGITVNIIGENFRSGCEVFIGSTKVDPRENNIRVRKEGSVITIKRIPPGKGVAIVKVTNFPGDKERERTAVMDRAFFYGAGAQAILFRMEKGLLKFWFWVQAGKWVMYPILVLSIIALALIFHGLLAIRESQLIPRRLVEGVAEHLSNGHLGRASEICRTNNCAFGRIVLAGIQRTDQSAQIIRDAINAAGAREADRLQQKINYLSNIGTISPMLGLFGTVWGLQLAFEGIAHQASQGLLLASAIAVALNTTIAGLIVGIIAFVAYFLFRGKVTRLVSTMEILAEEMAERIIVRKGTEE